MLRAVRILLECIPVFKMFSICATLLQNHVITSPCLLCCIYDMKSILQRCIWLFGNNKLKETIIETERLHLKFNTTQTLKLHKELKVISRKEKVILYVSLNKCIHVIFALSYFFFFVHLYRRVKSL